MVKNNMDSSYSQIVALIWNIADDVLRDVFLRGQYRDVILPMVVLRRLDALLEPTKEDVEEEIKESGVDNIDEGVLKDITRLSYFNTSKWTLNRLKSQASDNNDILYDNFVEYLNGYSENVRDVLRNFEYYTKARKLADTLETCKTLSPLKALEFLHQGGDSQILNLGTEKGFSVLEMVQATQKVTGRNVPYEFAARRPGDPAIILASVKKARQILNWEPTHSQLENIISSTWNAYQKSSL